MPPIRSSPRKPTPSQRRLNADNPQKSKRAPPRCLRCEGPNYPLRKDCILHSKNAGKRNQNAAISQPPRPASPSDSPIQAPVEPFEPEPRQLFLDSPQPPQGGPDSDEVFMDPPQPQTGHGHYEDVWPPFGSLTSGETRTLLTGLHESQQVFEANLTGQDVVRTGALLGRVERKDMNRRYVRSMDRLLLNCEKLADETDCWLYIAAHHPSSHGEYIHFTSPSMRNDLPPQAREVLDHTSSTIFSALKAARRQDVASVELSAARARAERDAALNEAAQKQRVIDELCRAIKDQGVDMDISRINLSPSAGTT
ncbi:hypothetical protein V5O48_009595 [Marasmius crinis-equi]|uniref:Gag protein n=1 Tax=Marasmius crinis-equi TaxID=585013 RepID=A0ABR3FAM4_9AGAR